MDNKKQLDGLDMEKVNKIAEHYEAILSLLGEDTSREGLVKTPMRAAKAMAFLTSGYRKDADKIVKSAIFSHEGSRMVIVKDIEFHSLCEHHILPRLLLRKQSDGRALGASLPAHCLPLLLQSQNRSISPNPDESLSVLCGWRAA